MEINKEFKNQVFCTCKTFEEIRLCKKIKDVFGCGLKEKPPIKPKCYNCKHAGKQFKVGNLTHLHCEDEKQYPKEKWESGELTAWDSLQQFNWTCENHEFKTKNI